MDLFCLKRLYIEAIVIKNFDRCIEECAKGEIMKFGNEIQREMNMFDKFNSISLILSF